MALPRLCGGTRSPTAAIVLAGPNAPNSPATNLAASRVAKLFTNAAAIDAAPTPHSASTISGLLPSRSESSPVKGAPSAQGKEIATPRSPSCASGTSRSFDRSTSSGPTIVIAVAQPVIAAVTSSSEPVPTSCCTGLTVS